MHKMAHSRIATYRGTTFGDWTDSLEFQVNYLQFFGRKSGKIRNIRGLDAVGWVGKDAAVLTILSAALGWGFFAGIWGSGKCQFQNGRAADSFFF